MSTDALATGVGTMTSAADGTGGADGAAPRRARRAGTALMGFAGGMVPSPSAVLVLVGAAATGRAWFGVVLVLAYGLGLAITLMLVGLVVVGSGRALARRLTESAGETALRWRLPASGVRFQHGLRRLVPLGSSAAVLLLGLGLLLRSAPAAFS